jgi:hypothetical protein
MDYTDLGALTDDLPDGWTAAEAEVLVRGGGGMQGPVYERLLEAGIRARMTVSGVAVSLDPAGLPNLVVAVRRITQGPLDRWVLHGVSARSEKALEDWRDRNGGRRGLPPHEDLLGGWTMAVGA